MAIPTADRALAADRMPRPSGQRHAAHEALTPGPRRERGQGGDDVPGIPKRALHERGTARSASVDRLVVARVRERHPCCELDATVKEEASPFDLSPEQHHVTMGRDRTPVFALRADRASNSSRPSTAGWTTGAWRLPASCSAEQPGTPARSPTN